VEFYKPIPIVQLRTAAAAGPVIIVNVSSYRCDALVVHADRIQVIELPDLSAEDVADRAGRFLTATDSGSSGDLNDVIVWTWESIAEPVLRELGVTGPPRDGERVPRIWWCPTGMATFLPFHAAGNHVRESSETPRSVLDWTASSYTSTLRALFRLGEMPERSESSRHEMLVVKVASSRIAPDAPPLTGVERDVELLKERFLGLTVLEDDNATCEEVLRAMRSHSRVHFACHGLQDLENPSDGHLALYDERLTIRRIAQQHLPPGELAFVSACETFRAGRSIPDEGTTLAAALQLVGYRHVVATHWKLFGGLTEQVASAFYDTAAVERSEGDPPALEGVAEALRAAMLRAREESDYAPPLYWAPYIHVGP
jgi:CHAT domain-containing protein